MLYDLALIEMPPVTAALILGGLLGLAFGALAQVSRFCFRRALVQGPDRAPALGTWLTALAVSILVTQGLVVTGVLDFSTHRFTTAALPWLAILTGGAAFGAGMVLTRGCISRLTVLSASGNLRAVTVIAAFAITAHATLKGVLSPLRTGLGAQTVDLGAASAATGWPGGALVWALVAVAVLAFAIARLRPRPAHLIAAAGIGLLAPLAWFGTGVLLLDDFDPIPLESLSFTAPWSETLFWTIASTSVPAGFGTGLIGGVLAGALALALFRGEFRWQSFGSPAQTGRYLAGGAMMGFGGVLAGGCTVGAGLSGVGTLSVSAMLALGAIAVGALATDRALRGAGREGQAVPAE